jgi:hypothetical protein
LAVAVIVALGAFFTIDHRDSVMQEEALIAQGKAAEQLQQVQQQLKQAQADRAMVEQSYEAVLNKVNSQNKQLQTQVTTRDEGLKQELTVLPNAPQSHLVDLWKADTGVKSLRALDDQTLAISNPDAELTVQVLESGRVAQADVVDVWQELQGSEKKLTAAQELIGSLQRESVQSQIILAKQKVVDQAECTVKMAKSRKRHWVITAVAFVGGIFAGRKL